MTLNLNYVSTRSNTKPKIIRIVKLSFHHKNTKVFLANFETNKTKIRNFPGCEKLELLRDKNETNVFFTYSYWKSEKDLDTYRNSELFKGIWAKTKTLFNNKPLAWSVERLERL